MHTKLTQSIKTLPNTPGIYQFFDKEGKLLYIGKAKRLYARVKTYFKLSPSLAPASNLSLRIKNMISKTAKLEYIKVDTEHDAFILENSLIKQLKPKYNILLRDDKTYPYIFINLDDEFPRFEITRKIVKGKNIKYFGPFSTSAKEILNAIYLAFPLIQKKGCLKGKKACLFYQIKRCYAPCEEKISQHEYKKIVDTSIKYIHQLTPLINLLHVKMHEYSENENYERAAEMRDMIKSIKAIKNKNYIDIAKIENFDLIALFYTEKIACGMRFFIREGKIVSTAHTLAHSQTGFDEDEIYRQMILSFYSKEAPIPIKTIYTAHNLKESQELSSILSSWHSKKITIKHPQRGEKKRLASLALKNAEEIVEKRKHSHISHVQTKLQELLELKNFPYSIEVYDNSHLGGVANVGAIVSWEGEDFNKTKYRHYHLKNKDEYSQMSEILTQRALRFYKESPPDLWLIDGGATLLNLALDIVQSSGLEIDVIAISKEKIDAKSKRAKGASRDIIHTKHRSYTLPTDDKRLQFLQRLRDEAHRFAISFHRKTKLKLDKESSRLKNLGLSEAKIKKLLLYFGTFEKIEDATQEELIKLIGKTGAKKLLTML